MEQRPHSDHAGEVIRIIDRVLAEEGMVLDGLRKAVNENAISEQEGIARFNAYRKGLRGEPIHDTDPPPPTEPPDIVA